MGKHNFIFVSIMLAFLSACSSVPSFDGKGDLCGLVVDEKNRPIKDFAVFCSDEKLIEKAVFTNESGIFVFYDMPSGRYKLQGEKEGYGKLKNVDYLFYDRGKIVCCQVSGIDATFDAVEKLILLGDYEGGMILLDNLVVEANTNADRVLTYYREFISNKLMENMCEDEIKETDA